MIEISINHQLLDSFIQIPILEGFKNSHRCGHTISGFSSRSYTKLQKPRILSRWMSGLYVAACRLVQHFFGSLVLHISVCPPLSLLNLGIQKWLLDLSPTSLLAKVLNIPLMRKLKATSFRHHRAGDGVKSGLVGVNSTSSLGRNSHW